MLQRCGGSCLGLLMLGLMTLALASCGGGGGGLGSLGGGGGGGGPTPLAISTTTLPNGEVGIAYNQSIVATGGTTPYTFTVFSGTLPSGLSLSVAGALTGTPSVAGTFNFTVRVVDTAVPTPASVTRSFALATISGHLRWPSTSRVVAPATPLRPSRPSQPASNSST